MKICAPDDTGLMKPNWSGKYDDGTAPSQWLSSNAVLEEFWKTRKPVKYGQCYVFAALATTCELSLNIIIILLILKFIYYVNNSLYLLH